MTSAVNSTETCALVIPVSRRFYVHVGSFGFLVAAQPSIFEEVARALALSGASRALDQAVQDWAMLSPSGADPALAEGAGKLHDWAADALRTAFQCIVHLIPPRFGATELLLGPSEQINAWCYEDGYLTYATDESAAAIMYAESGSLRQLRSQIRRSPDFDPALEMISGQSLFLFDQGVGTGPGTARFYKKQAERLLRNFRSATFAAGYDSPALVRAVEESVSSSAKTFDGRSLIDSCLRRGSLMITTLLRSMPAGSAGSAEIEESHAANRSAGVFIADRLSASTTLILLDPVKLARGPARVRSIP
jgi:hypothetical protein